MVILSLSPAGTQFNDGCEDSWGIREEQFDFSNAHKWKIWEDADKVLSESDVEVVDDPLEFFEGWNLPKYIRTTFRRLWKKEKMFTTVQYDDETTFVFMYVTANLQALTHKDPLVRKLAKIQQTINEASKEEEESNEKSR